MYSKQLGRRISYKESLLAHREKQKSYKVVLPSNIAQDFIEFMKFLVSALVSA